MKRWICVLLLLALSCMLFACAKPQADDETGCKHHYEVTNTVAANCTQAGLTSYRCSKCGDSYSEEIPQLEHYYQSVECGSPKICSLCGAEGEQVGDHQYAGYSCVVCGSETDTFVIPEDGYDGSEVTIVFYHTMSAALQALLDSYIVDFNAMYPNIHIEHRAVGSYDDVRDRVTMEIATGDQPNITYCYPDHVAIYNGLNAVVPLDDLIASKAPATRGSGIKKSLGLSNKEIGDFIEGFYEGGSQFGDGLMYSLPMSKSTEVLYYNKTFFDANGLSAPTTWEEMEEVCRQILQLDPDSIPLYIDSEANWFINMCAQYGSPYTSATGEHYLFNNATSAAFVQEFREWYQNGYVATFQTTGGIYGSSLFTGQYESNCYMVIGSSAGASYYSGEAEVGIVGIPQVDPGNPKVISQGPDLCILKNDDPQAVLASWLFVKFLTTNDEFQADLSMETGYLPVIESAYADIVYKMFLSYADGFQGVRALSANVALSQVDAFFTTDAFVGSAQAREQVGNVVYYACILEDAGDSAGLIRRLLADAVANCP